MSFESRLVSGLRRSKKEKEPERPDYSEPDFGGWAAKLDNFAPAPKAAPAKTAPEPPRPDPSGPDYTAWAAKLNDFTPAPKAAPAKTAPEPAAVTEPVEAAAAVEVVAAVEAAPAVAPADNRPSLEAVLDTLLSFDGAMCVAVVDSETGMILGKAGSGVDIDLAAAGASVILRARLASIKALGGGDEAIEDVLISLTSQVQIIHPLPRNPSIFTYLIGDKARSSLAMARFKATEADLLIQL
jgi:predicted regulator of Ras-like GTPase activity (Roadblock/LC7/MglB family)